MTVIKWIVLPNGLRDGSLKLTVLVSPKLDVSVDEIGVWPERVPTLRPSLHIGGQRVDGLSLERPDTLWPDLWRALFPSSTPVRRYVHRDPAKIRIASYGSGRLAGSVRDAYREVAAKSPTSHPALLSSLQATRLLAESKNATQFAAAQYSGMVQRPGAIAPLLVRDGARAYQPLGMTDTLAAQELVSAAVFLNHQNLRTGGLPPSLPPPPQAPPSQEFHDAIAHLSDQPEVLRRLGLILDYLLPLDKIPAALLGGRAGATVAFALPATVPWTSITPATRCTITTKDFRALASATTDIPGGMLALDDNTRFAVEQIDVDAAVSALANVANNVDASMTVNGSDPTSLPALRSHGFSILRKDRDSILSSRMTRSLEIDGEGSAAMLNADDLLRGYRIDVSSDGGATWRSLCRRTGRVIVTGAAGDKLTVTLPDAGAGSGRDEGYVKASAPTTPVDAADLLRVGEALFGWSGWSLAARRPGQTVSFQQPDKSSRRQTTAVEALPNVPPPSSPFQVAQHVKAEPGSLPRLRYGQQYSFRARAVDLAGNSLPWSQSGGHASPPQAFVRYEPVVTPVLVCRRQITEGESIEHLVIRSADGQSAAAYAAALNASTGTSVYAATSERHVSPPSTSQMMAERHGVFDAIAGAGGPQLAYNVACKEAGSFLDTRVIVPDATNHDPQPTVPSGRTLVVPQQSGAPILDKTTEISPRGAALPADQYVFFDTDKIDHLPYLPDPMAAGARLATSSMPFQQPSLDVSRGYENIGTKDAWNALPFRLVLADGGGSGAITVTQLADALTVALPAGTTLWLDYSSTLAPDKLSHFAWSEPALQALTGDDIAGGKHWMITPKRRIALVHATPRPVTAPVLTNLIAAREKGDTFAWLTGTVDAHVPSTAHVDIEAHWTEWDDDLGKEVDHHAKPMSVRFAYGDGPAALRQKHELGDTRARLITYTPVGTTRYREYFPAAVSSNPSALTRAGAGSPIIVPATATPPAPSVLYVVPSFKWAVSADGNTKTRTGGALRIYLDRPWFTSGYDERLAVVIVPQNGAPPDNEALSQLGYDPLFLLGDAVFMPAGTSILLGAADLEIDGSRAKLVRDVPLQTGQNVDVVAYAPEWSEARKLFYVDVELKNRAYHFASLYVARLQEHSIAREMMLSPAARIDFTLLPADRSATVTSGAGGVHVSVTGITATNTLPPDGPGHGPGGEGPPHLPPHGPPRGPHLAAPIVPRGKIALQVAASGRTVTATLEANATPAPSTADARENELGWTPITSSATFLDPVSLDASGVTWSGTIRPFQRQPGTRYRVVVRELETRQTDREASTRDDYLAAFDRKAVPIRDMLVYFDIFDLP